MHTQSFTRLALLMALSLSGFATKNVLDATKVRHRRVEMLDDMVHRRAEGMVEAHLVARMPEPAQLAPRQTIAANLTGSDPANLDQNMLDATISAACKAALGPIKSVDNDAGFLACYNIPFLNTNTGVFEADLRLYQISEPKGAFANIRPTDISVQLSFPNAAFSIIPQTTRKRRRDTVDLETRQSPGAMDELQNFLFVGQVSKDLTISKLEDKELMSLLIPTIQLGTDEGAANAGSTPPTKLTSSSMVYFVSGVFEGQSASGAAAAEPTAAAAAAEKAGAFELPGTTLGIFPVGLIITSIWALLFFSVVGYGTWERIQFRDQFRLRKEKAVAAGKA